ncbi:MAG: hypothetical protein UFG06_13755 [Lachnospiraceae bacterium]|nr:hypothetical protein [Lachnospiraceae bacterium]
MKNKNVKRIAALIAVILLVALYVVTLFAAIFDTSASGSLFRLCLVCTVAVPLLAWIFIWIYGQTTGKKTIADLNLMQDPHPQPSFGEDFVIKDRSSEKAPVSSEMPREETSEKQ